MSRTVVGSSKWVARVAAIGLLLGLGACGGGGGDGDGVGGRSWTESSLAKNLREKCGQRHSYSTAFLYCAAGTYEGRDQLTGKACSTTITAEGQVLFVNGGRIIGPFKAAEDGFNFEKPAGTTHWTLLVKASSGDFKDGIELTVDTKRSSEIRIRQKYGSSLNTTCVTPF